MRGNLNQDLLTICNDKQIIPVCTLLLTKAALPRFYTNHQYSSSLMDFVTPTYSLKEVNPCIRIITLLNPCINQCDFHEPKSNYLLLEVKRY